MNDYDESDPSLASENIKEINQRTTEYVWGNLTENVFILLGVPEYNLTAE